MPQDFSAPPSTPTVSGYQTSNILGISDAGRGFDPMASGAQTFYQQVPMSRPQGSTSLYGHSSDNGFFLDRDERHPKRNAV
jgi:hypothetical protein